MLFDKARLSALTGALALLFVIAVTPAAFGAERYTWNGPFNVTVDPGQTYGFDPAIVHTTGGTFFALMAGTVNGTGGFYLISSTDGMNWGTPTYVTSGWDEGHIIQGQDGYLYASLSKSGGVEIWRGSSSGTGWAFWGQVVSMGGSQQYWSGSLTQAPDGTFYSAFMDHDGVSHHVYVSSSSNGSSWSSKVLVPGPGGTSHYFDPSVMEIGGTLYVAYNSYTNYEIWMSDSTDGGATWSAPWQVTSGAGTSAAVGPSIVEGPGGTIVVAYGTGAKGLSISESADGGTTWTESQAQPTGWTPTIIKGHDHNFWIIYADTVGSAWEIYTTYAPLFELTISPDPLVAGQSAAFTVSNGLPNANAYLGYSLTGPGSTFVPQLNVTLGIANPQRAAGPTKTNSAGSVVWNLPVPPAASGRSIWIQAAQQNQATNVKATKAQ